MLTPADLASLPKPPHRPDPLECCGRGCCPCIFDYYDDALERWERIVRLRGFEPQEVLEALAGGEQG